MRVDFVSVVVVVSLCWYEENFYAIATDVCGDVYSSDRSVLTSVVPCSIRGRPSVVPSRYVLSCKTSLRH